MSCAARRFVPSGGFHLRTPLLPFDAFLAWGEGLEAGEWLEGAGDLEKPLARDLERQRRRLRDAVSSREFRDALFVASPDLDEALGRWLSDPGSERGRRVERAAVKYFSRAAGRATPFGLFAGTSVGRIGTATDLALEPRAQSLRHSRLGMDYLFALCGALAKDEVSRAGFLLKPNSSLYEGAGHLRYVRLDGERRMYHLVGLERSDALADTLARAAGGATAAVLAAALAGPRVPLSDAERFISELVDSQVLVPDLGLVVTGVEPTLPLAARLSSCEATRDVARALETAEAALETLDAGGLGAAPGSYRAIAEALGGLPAKPETRTLFQVDLVKRSAGAVLGGAVLREMTRAADLVRRLLPQQPSSELETFRDAFRERYEGREVPLVDALDEESGLGFPVRVPEVSEGSPLVADLPPLATGPATVAWGVRERRLLERLDRAAAAGETEITLGEKDLEALSHPSPPPLPDAFAVMARVAAVSTEAIAKGHFRVLVRSVTGPSGAALLGRFCHADPETRCLVEEHLRAEEALEPDALFAEIVHLPEGGIGNILLRPVLRGHEIAFLGQSGAPAGDQIPVTDLLLSLEGDSLRLRSRRLGRRVIPRLTSAHRFARRSLGIYRFLCTLQCDGRASGPAWSWGPLDGAPFLPRLTHGRLVLSPATWNLAREELASLEGKTAADRFSAVQALRSTRSLPRLVVVADDDNELPVDLAAALSVESFVHLVKGREQARLEEMFPPPHELCATGPEGRYVHEVVVPFVRTAMSPVRAGRRPPDTLRAPAVKRSFPPGSEWLYAKLYSGVATADRLLLKNVAPLADEAVASGAADRWFFIRYADPREHLRVRIHGDPERLRAEVLPRLLAMASSTLEGGAVWKVQLDTYEREVERYGGTAGIELAERLFCADSDAVVAILRLLGEGTAGHEERWRICLVGLDALLSDLGFDLAGKVDVVGQARNSYGVEQREDAVLRRALGERTRRSAGELGPLLAPGPDAGHPLAPGVEVLRKRSERFAPVVAELRANERDGRLSRGISDLAPSFLHMHAIRMFRAAAKRNEIVLYHLLSHLYREREARAAAASK